MIVDGLGGDYFRTLYRGVTGLGLRFYELTTKQTLFAMGCITAVASLIICCTIALASFPSIYLE